MSQRPDIAAALSEGETLLWQGHPKRGRPVSHRGNILGALFFGLSLGLMVFAWWLAIYWGHLAVWRLAVYGVIGTAAFLMFVSLRVTFLDRRRARSRDARTAYAITDRRVMALAGPYRAEIPLGPDVQATHRAGGVDIARADSRIRFDRLADAKQAHDILTSEIGRRQ